MPRDESLHTLLLKLKEKRLLKKFCDNKDNQYIGKYDHTYLSKIISGKRYGSVYYNRVISEDIKSFLYSIQE